MADSQYSLLGISDRCECVKHLCSSSLLLLSILFCRSLWLSMALSASLCFEQEYVGIIVSVEVNYLPE